MFSWRIAKSAEAMFSRWAIKRICKFLLKKKLGEFILGDIDLNQLDVQLGAGIIQLSDLALNVDYINEKLSTTAVLVREGSIGSLMVTLPWKNGGCQIEVDELEVVLAPRRVKVPREEFENCSRCGDGDNGFSHGVRKLDTKTPDNMWSNSSVDVHEGVKTIAKMVKWLLTSFHVKIKNLIVAFDPLLEEENKKGLDRILVLRISEVECGAHISEDPSSSNFTTSRDFLGLGRLTNFVEFHGAVLELLHVDGLDLQSLPECSTETSSNRFSGHCSHGNMTTVISGERGGFSGNIKLSLPWKNGSLDIHKVEANLHVEPLELRLQPITIRCFIFLWDLFNGISEDSEDNEDTGYLESTDSFSVPNNCVLPSDKEPSGNEGTVTNISLMDKEPLGTLLSESHLISDWVSRSQKGENEKEPDFGASVDQFFECFDELRNSQSALGNSGMWNWTCSVFSAITAASNLASGSLHVPSEQQHVETNFNAAIAKLSLLLFFNDEDQKQSPKMNGDKANNDVIHCVCAQFVELCFNFQVCTLEMNFGGFVQHIQLVDHLFSKNESPVYKAHGCCDNSESEIALIQKMQDSVQDALRAFRDSKKDPGIGPQFDHSVDISLSNWDVDGCCHMTEGKYILGKYTSVTLLKTSGVSSCHFGIALDPSGGTLMGPTFFSLKLPPFVFWLNLGLITKMLEFLKEMANCVKSTHVGSNFVLEPETKKIGLLRLKGDGQISHPKATNLPSKKIFNGNIFVPNARIILCFPLKECNDFSSYSSCNQFIALDFISRTIGGKDVQAAKLTSAARSNNRHAVPTSCSLHLNFGNFYIFSITSDFTEKIVGSETYIGKEARFFVEKIISAVNNTDDLTMISMFWQDGPVTGPWIAKKAKHLASSENGRSEAKVVGKSCEFASVTTVKDSKDFESRTRQEILSSSAFFLHGHLPSVAISLDKSQYENTCGLLNQMFEHFSGIISESVGTQQEYTACQTAILVEFDSVTVSIAVEPDEEVKCPIRSELPGSWHSLTVQVDKFELLSVSNIGGIRTANFLWVAHGQGSLWGSITEGLHRDFLLISCSDSTAGRGDGEGTNVLSSRYSGSDIINLWDPESNHNFSSITVRCATIVAMGGRLDWFNKIFSFFHLASSESDLAGIDSRDKTCGSSFILNLVDVGLSYEPYFKKLTANHGLNLKPSECDTSESKDVLNVACLLAASSLKLSNTTVIDCTTGKYKIRLQDLGLLICGVSQSKLVGHTYSVGYLSKIGYVKVAGEAHLEALLTTNSQNGHAWELECGESSIMLNTCHDTTFGLIRLAGQLQNLFAPDMEDYIVHLENRGNNVQWVFENSDKGILGGEFSQSLSQTETLSLDKKSNISNLMDQIREDVFRLDENSDGQAKIFGSNLPALVNNSSLVASGASSSVEKIPEFIEEYFVSDLSPLSELASNNKSSDILDYRNGSAGEAQIGNNGWYEDSSLRILEDHASKVEQTTTQKPAEHEASTSDVEHGNVGKAEGCIILKNMNVIWRMYGGSDWSDTCQASATACSRDTTVCLELAFSGIEFEYDVHPEGEMFASRLSLTIQDFCLNDRSENAPWKLVLGYYQSKKHPRDSSSKAMKLNLEAVKPDPSIHIEENRLRIALLPICLHLHQNQLDFLISFFGVKSSSADPSPSTSMDLSKSGERFEKSDNLMACAISEEAFLTYFQKFDIRPMLIRVDYHPCRVDLTALGDGKYVELVNLVPWKGVELQLKHVQGVGLYGWSSVCETILAEWLEDISRNQIRKLLRGLPTIKSLVAVGSGAAQLVSLPLKNYKEDHRLLKGLQRGTFTFLRNISLEAIGLGVHLAAGAHNILLQAEYILASIPPSVPWPAETRVGTNMKSNQPSDAQQGIQQACQSISDGIGKSASALVHTPFKRYHRGAGMGSALSTAVQSAPAAAIAPASATVGALHCALLGFRNSLDPERKSESLEKYLGRTPQSMQ